MNTSVANTENSTMGDTCYKRTKGAAGIEGLLCEIHLSMLFLLRGETDDRVEDFHLAPNMEEADKLDDVVFRCVYKAGSTRIVFLQSKHKTEQKKPTININNLLSDSESGDFSLKKYFISYCKIKQLFSEGKGPMFSSKFEDCEFIIYTNARFDSTDCSVKEEEANVNDIIRISDSHNKYYRLEFKSDKKEKIVNLLKYASNSRRLAKELVQCIHSGKWIDMRKDIFQIYHKALQEKVIEKMDDKLEGRLCENFLSGAANLSSGDAEFRRVFLEEAGAVFKKQGDELKQELQQKVIKLSSKFGDNVGGESLVLPVDHITEEEIQEFLNKFKLFSSQPSERELEKIIKDELKDLFKVNQDDVNQIFADVQKTLQKWWTQQNEYKYLTKDNRFFKNSKENPAYLRLIEITKLNTSRIERPGLRFKSDEINRISEMIHEKRVLTIVTDRDATLLTGIKVYQTLETMSEYKLEMHDYKYIFMSLSSVLNLGNGVIDAFNSPRCHLLVIECGGKEKNIHEQWRLYNQLHELIQTKEEKKIILITHGEDHLSRAFKDDFSSGDEYAEVGDKNSLADLTDDSQQLLEKRKVIFQGEEVDLGTLVDDKSRHLVTAQELSKLISDEKLVIHKASDGLGEIKYYYIDRIFNRRVNIKCECFKENNINDLFVVSNIEENELSRLTQGQQVRKFNNNDRDIQNPARVIILEDEEDVHKKWKQLCQDYKNYNVHWLRKENGAFIWKESQGVLSSLRRFVDESSNVDEYEADEITDITSRVVIVSAEPGMGKSTVLTKLIENAKQRHPSLWVVRINLNDYTTNLNKIKEIGVIQNQDEAINFLSEIIELKTLLEQELFKRRINDQGEIAFCFDGYDEISPAYNEIVIQLLKFLKGSKVEKLWITTRPHMKHELEDRLGVLSFTLKPLSTVDQTKFLMSFWRRAVGPNLNRPERYVRELLDIWSNSIADKEVEFTGIPLQTRMLAEALQDNFKEFIGSDQDVPMIPKKLDLVDLYKRFIDNKYKIHCGEKKKEDPTNVAVEKDNAKLREYLNANHQMAAVYTLFTDNEVQELFSKKKLKKVQEFIDQVKSEEEMTGIIYQVTNDKPNFIHRTFAEYFAADWLADNQEEPCVKDFIRGKMFNGENEVLRNFFDRLLAADNHSENTRRYELHNAVLNDNRERVQELLSDSPESIDCVDKGGRTALHLAAAYGYEEVAQDLLSHNAKVTLRDGVLGWSALRYADKVSNWGIAELLLKSGADGNDMEDAKCNIKSTILDANDGTLLHTAAEAGYIEFVKFIINENFDVNARNRSKDTPLHWASRNGRLVVVKYLTGKGANINAQEEKGMTPLHWATLWGQLDLVKYLTENGANINAQEVTGMTPLHVAARGEKFDIVDYLIEKGANINAQEENGMTPLYRAAKNENLDIVKYLIEKGANINAQEEKGMTPLHWATLWGQLDIVKYLTENGANINAQSVTGMTPLHGAAQWAEIDTLKYLIEKGANINAQEVTGMTPLHVAARGGKFDIVDYLIEKGANINAQEENGMTLLHWAVRRGQLNIVEYLTEKGANINAQDVTGTTPLYWAAKNENLDILKYLTEKGANINAQEEKGMTPLHWVSLRGVLDIVKYLIDKGANINAQDLTGMTPLNWAAQRGKFDIVKYLIDKGANINAQDVIGMTPLHWALQWENLDIVKYLTEKGANINAQGLLGMTPLHWVSLRGVLDIVKYLIDKGANINAQDLTGMTPLHWAAQKGKLDIVQYLIEKGADINAQGETGITPLYWAAQRGKLDVVTYLTEIGASINAQ